jgi:hypothetical protein
VKLSSEAKVHSIPEVILGLSLTERVIMMQVSFEVQVLLQRIVLPSLLGFAGGLLLSRCERRSLESGALGSSESPLRGVITASVLGSLIVGAGLIASDLWQRELITNPAIWRRWAAREPWMWMVWMIPGLILFLGLAKGLVATPSRFATWCLPGVVAWGAGIFYVCLPQGPGYENDLPRAVRWIALGIAAVAMNCASLNAIARGPGGRWAPLVLLVQLVFVAGLALQSYASLGEFILAATGATLGLSIVSLFLPSTRTFDYGWPLAPAILGLTVLACASLATSTFYISEPPATWILMSVLFLPTVAGAIDLCLGGKHWGWRVAAAFFLWALALSAVVAT